MNISPAIIIDVALIAVIVVSVFHYARKGFVAGLMDLVGNLASLALAWVVSGKLSPTVFENFFKSGLIEQTARTIQQQGGVKSCPSFWTAFRASCRRSSSTISRLLRPACWIPVLRILLSRWWKRSLRRWWCRSSP